MSASSAHCEETAPSPTSDSSEAADTTSALTANKIAETKFWETAKESLAAFTSRLGGGGFGDLRIEGSRPTHARYHKEAWDIVEALQEAIAIKNREYRLAELAEQKKAEELHPPSKSAAKMSANGTKAMENVVEQQTASKFRDLSIKMEEMATQLEKTQKRNEQLETKLAKIEAKGKKSSVGAEATVSVGQYRAAVTRIEKLEKQLKGTEENEEACQTANARIDSLSSTVDRLDAVESTRPIRDAEVERKIDTLRLRVNAVEDRELLLSYEHGLTKEDLEAFKKDMLKLSGDIERDVDGLWSDVGTLEREAADQGQKLQAAESKIEKLEADSKASEAEWQKQAKDLTDASERQVAVTLGLNRKTRDGLEELDDRIRHVQRESGHQEFARMDSWTLREAFQIGQEIVEEAEARR